MDGRITFVIRLPIYKNDLLRDEKAYSAEFAEPLGHTRCVLGVSSTNAQHTIDYQKKRVIMKKSLMDVCGSPSWTISRKYELMEMHRYRRNEMEKYTTNSSRHASHLKQVK